MEDHANRTPDWPPLDIGPGDADHGPALVDSGHPRLALAVALGSALALGLLAPAARAQPPAKPEAPVTLPEPLTREAIRELIARLSDAEVRQLLLAQLDKAAAPGVPGRAPDMAGMMRMEKQTDLVRRRLLEVGTAAPRVPEALTAALGRLTEGRDPGHVARVAVLFAAMLAIGWATERLFEWLTGDVRRRLAGRPRGDPAPSAGARTDGAAAAAGRLVLRLVFDLVTLLVFGVAAAATFFVAYHGHEATRQLVMAGLAGVMLVRLVAVAARFLLAPRDPGARLLSFDDAAARRLHGAVVALAGIYAVADIGLGLLVHWGLAEDVYLLLHLTLVLLFVGLFLYACWRSRADIAVLIRGGEGTGPLRRLLAELWPVLMTLYVAIIVLAGVIERLSGMRFAGYAGIWSLLIVIVLPLVDLAGSRLLAAEMGARGDGSGASAYEPVLRQGIHIVLTVAGLLLIARLWGLDLFALSTRSVGDRLTQALFSIAVTLLVAYLAWRLLRTAIDRRLEREAGPRAGREPGEEGGGQGASRLRTLLPMVRAFVFVSLCVMATMISLASLGLNIGPLLAGAGVVGIALGFGAQTLVRDIVSGMFFLIDDAFRLGEYIDVGPVKGTVEKISLRSMQIRHHRGALHTVPYGQITRLTNESRDWVIVKLEFRLTYDADLVQVKRILKRIGEELQQDPELGPSILQPLKSQGIMGTDDSALVVRAKFMAKPDDRQYVVRREAYNRIVKAFAESGIRFAHRQVTVFAPPGAGAGAAGAASAALADGKTDGTAGI